MNVSSGLSVRVLAVEAAHNRGSPVCITELDRRTDNSTQRSPLRSLPASIP
ncbi:hypothetical protein OG895_42315 [Streptomyces sp. NBC_00201]|uniref:hypothetical protein n=1 Tax=unclassified Streptomyces TaxID=2593676 RepID=UPI00224F7603|nr:hypothetical protein [Streptomyces sp. NBC_00201]MCX5251714.1 hypothetical protein [Streptomyces sp. NBC_00201]